MDLVLSLVEKEDEKVEDPKKIGVCPLEWGEKDRKGV
jgi:hypothetical protein